ncbi:MAG: hypothetical protein ACTS4W_01145, partial [Candidatus Hodgkinia cicadicola]
NKDNLSFPGTEEGKTNITPIIKLRPLTFACSPKNLTQQIVRRSFQTQLTSSELTYLTLWTSVVFQTEVPSINNSTFHQSNLI